MPGNEKNSSWTTIFSLVNTMIGGAMLTLPLLFRTSGVLTGILILLISGVISYKTCMLYILHMAEEEEGIQETILRLLNKKWQNFFKLLTGFYLVCLNIIYVELIVDQTYDIIYYILQVTDHADWIAGKNVDYLVFDKFSIQYLSLIMFIPLLAIIFIKNLTFLIRLTSFGVISVIVYIAFIGFQFGTTIYDGFDWNDLPLLKTDIGTLTGTCAVAFTIHTMVNPIMKANHDQRKNLRDLKISYILGFLIYSSIGLLGCATVLTKDCKTTIVNCYLDDWKALLVEVCYLFMLLTVFPCFLDVGRKRLLTQFYPEITDRHFRTFNVLFMFISTLFNFFSTFIPLDEIMGLVGSLLCFFFVYLIPTRFHWARMYGRPKAEHQSLLSESGKDEQISCPYSQQYKDRFPKAIRLIFYAILNFIGIVVGVYGIFVFFKDILFA